MKHMTIAEGLMVMVACMASAVTGQAGVMTDFMLWGAWEKKRFDPTLTAVESYNRGLAAMRRGYDPVYFTVYRHPGEAGHASLRRRTCRRGEVTNQ